MADFLNSAAAATRPSSRLGRTKSGNALPRAKSGNSLQVMTNTASPPSAKAASASALGGPSLPGLPRTRSGNALPSLQRTRSGNALSSLQRAGNAIPRRAMTRSKSGNTLQNMANAMVAAATTGAVGPGLQRTKSGNALPRRGVARSKSNTGNSGGLPRTFSGGALATMANAVRRTNSSRNVMAAMAAEEPANIFASDMVSSDFIMNRVKEVKNDPTTVRLEVEDLLVNIHHEKLLPVLKSLLLAGDREWKSVTFADSMDASDFKEWQGLKRDIMLDFDASLPDAESDNIEPFASSSPSLLRKEVITFQATVEVRSGTTLKALSSLLKIIKRHKSVCDVSFGGVLFGFDGESLKTALSDNTNASDELTSLVQVKVSCGWRAGSNYADKLDTVLKSVKFLMDKTENSTGENEVDMPAPLQRVKSAVIPTSTTKAELRRSASRSKSPINVRASSGPSTAVKSPRRLVRSNTASADQLRRYEASAALVMASNSKTAEPSSLEIEKMPPRSTLKRSKSALLSRKPSSSTLEPSPTSRVPDYNWATQNLNDEAEELKINEDRSGPDFRWDTKQKETKSSILDESETGIDGSNVSVNIQDLIGRSTGDKQNGHTLSTIFAESHASHIFAEGDEEDVTPLAAIVRTSLKASQLSVETGDTSKMNPCFRWDAIGTQLHSTGCMSDAKRECSYERRSQAAIKTSSQLSLSSVAKKKASSKLKANGSSAAMALMASIDSANTTKKSSKRAKGLKATKSGELPALRRIKSEGVPLREMRRIASQALESKPL